MLYSISCSYCINYRWDHEHFITFFFSIYSIDSEDVRLMLWDTAGQEEFDAITKAYYRGEVKESQRIAKM